MTKYRLGALCGAAFLCLADLNDAALAEAPGAVDATSVCDIGKQGALEAVFADHGPFDLVLLLDVLEQTEDPAYTQLVMEMLSEHTLEACIKE